MKDMGGGGGKLYLTEEVAVWEQHSKPCNYINTDLWKTWGGGGGGQAISHRSSSSMSALSLYLYKHWSMKDMGGGGGGGKLCLTEEAAVWG